MGEPESDQDMDGKLKSCRVGVDTKDNDFVRRESGADINADSTSTFRVRAVFAV